MDFTLPQAYLGGLLVLLSIAAVVVGRQILRVRRDQRLPLFRGEVPGLSVLQRGGGGVGRLRRLTRRRWPVGRRGRRFPS